MNQQPLVTVGLICFNTGNGIVRAFNNIFSQTWENYEIVVVDDCSQDSTWENLQTFAKQHSNVRIFQNEKNLGAGTSRNRIVNESNGEFIIFFDDDDASSPDRIVKQYNRIVSYEANLSVKLPVICHVSRKVIDSTGREWSVRAMGCNVGMAPHGEHVADFLLLGRQDDWVNGSIGTGIQMARKSSYLDAGNFDPEFRRCQDTELAVRWAMMGAHFVGLEEELVIQKFTVSSRKIDLERTYALKTFEKHKHYLINKKQFDFMIRWTNAKYDFLSSNKLSFLINIFFSFLRHPLLSSGRALKALRMIGYNVMLQRNLGGR